MVTITWLAFAVCMAQEPKSYTKDYKNALRYGAKAKMTLRIVDEAGAPVSNAVATIQFNPPKATKYVILDGISDSNGVVVAEGLTTQTVPGKVAKDGYYDSWLRFRSGNPEITDSGGESSKVYYESKVKDGRWLPWNPTIPVVLREIRNPIPMYVKWVDWVEIPVDTDVGFDCVIGDLVKPLGGGGHPDILLRISTENAGGRPKRLTLKSGEDDAGFAVKDVHASSAFKSDHFAPMDGYSSQVEAQMLPLIGGGEMVDSLLGKTSYLAFRSRISHGEDGSVTQANYGKIYGPLKFGHSEKPEVAVVRFLYYFNPTPNDRNIEFDGKNNLFKPGWNSKLNWSREP